MFTLRFRSAALAVAATAATLFVAAAPAIAQERDVRTADVRYDDLDLASAGGQKALQARIKRAARQVCARSGDIGLRDFQAYQSCRDAALEAAMPQVAALVEARGQRLASAEVSAPGTR